MEMSTKKLKELLSFGKYVLNQKGRGGYMNHQIAVDFKEFMDEVNRNIYSEDILVDTFTHHEDKDGSTIIDGILMYDFRGQIVKNNSKWTIVQERDRNLVVYKNYIEDIPELSYILQFLDGEHKHPIWFEKINTPSNTSYIGFVTFSGDYNKYLAKLEEAGIIEYIQASTIDMGGIINE